VRPAASSAVDRLRVIVAGMVAGDPFQGGASWAVLQYVEGLRRMGHDVVFVEPVRREALRPAGATLAESENARYFSSLPFVGRDERSALLVADSDETVGIPYSQLVELAQHADLLLNLSGLLRDERLMAAVPKRVFVDLDPGFNQVWSLAGHDLGLERHDVHVTVGLRVGKPGCHVPTCGLQWTHSLPPVVLEHWPGAGEPTRNAFTTIGNWRSYGSIEHRGVEYGQRAHSFRRLFDLPRLTAATFEPALAIHRDEERDLRALREHGWHLVDSVDVAGTPERYADFIRSSKAELGVPKLGYVASRSGWFSDRTACYLAAGRPALCWDTGFSLEVETGAGLLTFEDVAGAAAGVAQIESDWASHSAAARALAEERFDSRKVLARLLERCL
jgi:hypothetical protein